MSEVNTSGQINVLFVVSSLVRAGAETQVVNLVNGLSSPSIQKFLFTFETCMDQLTDINQDNTAFLNCARRSKFDVRPIKELARIIDDKEIDIVHCTTQFPLLLAWIGRFISKRKPRLIVALHTTKNRDLKEEAKDRFVYRWLIPRCSSIVYVCNAQQKYWFARYPHFEDISRVIYNGVDTRKYDPEIWREDGEKLRSRLGVPADAKVIVCVARFHPEKGHAILMHALKKVEDPPYLLLAGDGGLVEDIRSLVDALGLAGRVKFLGMLDDVRPALAAADLSLLASTAVETFSMAMLESMSMETPVLATDVGGLSEAIVPGETGFLVEPGDEEALSAVLRDIAADKYNLKDMGVKSRRLILEEFTNDRMIQETEKLLLELGNVV